MDAHAEVAHDPGAMAKRRSRPKVPHNPLNKPLLGAWLAVLAIGGIAALADVQADLSRLMLPLVLLLGLVSTAWTAMCWKLGCVAMPDHMGRVHHYFRAHGPVGFYVVSLIYASMCAGLVAYPTMVLLGL